VFALGVLLVTCYVPGWTGYGIPTGWIVLSVVLPLILRKEMLRWNPFLLYIGVSLLWAPVFAQGIYDLWIIAILSCAFCLGSCDIEPRRLYLGMAIGLSVSTAIAVFQALGWHQILYQESRPAGLFVNPNVFGETAALISVALLAHRIFWPLLWTVPSVLLSESRSGLTALLLIGAAWSANRYISVLMAIFIAGFVFLKPADSIGYRLEIWQSAYNGLTWFGRGAGSYIVTSPVFSPFHTEVMPNREENAHNDVLQLVYEYGLGALLLLPVILVAMFGPAGPERYLFFAFLFIACFNFPLAIPTEGFLGAFAMGRLWRDRSLAWDFCLRCGYDERRRLGPAQA
jgi:hypothetical protein